MGVPLRFLLGLLLVLGLVQIPMMATSLSYPPSPRHDQVDIYHGVAVPDPYRWLEDPQSAASRQWIEAQNQVTSAYLETLAGRSAISDRLTQLWNFERYSTPFKQGGRYFYFKNDGLQNQSVLYFA